MERKNKKLFYKIVEVSKITKVPPHVLRYWEKEYKVIKPRRSKDGKRLYKSEDIDKILKLKKLLDDGLKLEAAVKRLSDTSKLKDDSELIKEIINELESILKILS